MACKSRECVNEWFTHTHMNVLHLQTYIVMCKCFGMCTCMYYIPLMNMGSYKSILISCGCFWKLNFIFLQWATLVGLLQKKSWYFDIPQTLAFFINMGLWWCYWKRYPGMHILSHLIAWVQLLLLLLFLWVIFDNNFYYWALG
jgi:hypothetical protein